MTIVRDIYDFIDDIAPFDTAMEFDNCGLLVGDLSKRVNKVMVTLDITKEVIKEAREKCVALIVSHHPVIFKPLKRLETNSIPYLLAQMQIDAICAHTNLDVSSYGVNNCLANKLDLKNLRHLCPYGETNFNKVIVFVPTGHEENVIESMHKEGAGVLGEYSKCSFRSYGVGKFVCGEQSKPFIGHRGNYESAKEAKIEMICPKGKTKSIVDAMLKAHPYEQPAYDIFEDKAIVNTLSLGLVGDLDYAMNSEEFALYVKQKLSCEGVRYTSCNKKIKSVGLCSGAGGDMVPNALKLGVNAFVTGEIKHNRILELNSENVTLVDAGHFKTENVYVDYMIEIMRKKFEDLNIIKSSNCSDKIKYI